MEVYFALEAIKMVTGNKETFQFPISRYGAFETGAVLGANSIPDFISLSGGNPGRSSGNTSSNSLATGIFCTLGNDGPVVRPPKDFILASQKVWNNSLVGYFLGSSLPFKLIEEEAKRLWIHLGFLKLYMVKKGFYVFKFNSEVDRNKVLAAGPWHFKRNQIILQPWYEGKKLEKSGLLSMPIWAKIHDIPYSYWASTDGLSYVASAIGNPLPLDPISAKLEPLPYAKVLVEVNAKDPDPLPPFINIVVVDRDGITESILQSRVEYYNKPSHCSSCKVFGHSLAKCPNATPTWVLKAKDPKTEVSASQVDPDPLPKPAAEFTPSPASSQVPCDMLKDPPVTAQSFPEDGSPPIPFSGLASKIRIVDEVAKLKGILKTSSSCHIAKGGNISWSRDKEDFKDFLVANGLSDIRYSGTLHTWWNKQIHNPITRKLDRILGNPSWMLKQQDDDALFSAWGISDHCAAILNLHRRDATTRKPFQFFNYWLDHPEFMASVREAWDTQIHGHPMYVFAEKLKCVKYKLIALRKEEGDLSSQIDYTKRQLCDLQEEILNGSTDETILNSERALNSNLWDLLRREESIAHQRSRVQWLELGDNKTGYFHRKVAPNWNNSKILSLVDSNGSTITNDNAIKQEAVHHFKHLFNQEL
ncbi:hypothetical protein POM88_006833 [Heracleum sosnowskyi]|uniref:DUF4283 domain-containing protein n=1 Tax=Heracleum sosnowskyi TaxID=360622 RepID=A0AAD8J733_9APIA|nr:hypothetical protein POM88_006833 [Heracleum sosnowskyi]